MFDDVNGELPVGDRNLRERVAVVTGAAIGIGYEIARRLALEGARVVINDLDAAGAANAAEAIASDPGVLRSGGACISLAGDSSDPQIVDRMMDLAQTRYGGVDIAVANAGISPFGEFLTFQPEDLRRLIAVNIEGSFFLAQRAARQMIQQGNGGRILMMSSVTGYQHHPDATAYGMSKAAIRMLVKNLGVELARYRIGVNAVAPGATLTERTRQDPHYDATWSRITPSGRSATTSDIANAALFLLSAQSEHVTGQTLVIDGGWTSISPPPD